MFPALGRFITAAGRFIIAGRFIAAPGFLRVDGFSVLEIEQTDAASSSVVHSLLQRVKTWKKKT